MNNTWNIIGKLKFNSGKERNEVYNQSDIIVLSDITQKTVEHDPKNSQSFV